MPPNTNNIHVIWTDRSTRVVDDAEASTYITYTKTINRMPPLTIIVYNHKNIWLNGHLVYSTSTGVSQPMYNGELLKVYISQMVPVPFVQVGHIIKFSSFAIVTVSNAHEVTLHKVKGFNSVAILGSCSHNVQTAIKTRIPSSVTYIGFTTNEALRESIWEPRGYLNELDISTLHVNRLDLKHLTELHFDFSIRISDTHLRLVPRGVRSGISLVISSYTGEFIDIPDVASVIILFTWNCANTVHLKINKRTKLQICGYPRGVLVKTYCGTKLQNPLTFTYYGGTLEKCMKLSTNVENYIYKLPNVTIRPYILK